MKTNRKFWYCLIILMAVLYTGNLYSQVKIGEETLPKKFSLLEISAENQKGGLRLPQLTPTDKVTLDAYPDAITFKTSLKKGLVIYNDDTNCIEYWNGKAWKSICDDGGSSIVAEPKWFYMPSIVLDVSKGSTSVTVNLYDEYKRQFDRAAAGSLIIGNPGAPASPTAITKVYLAGELNYYIISYDDEVFYDITLSDAGVLTYKVNTSKLSEATHMNIAFVVK